MRIRISMTSALFMVCLVVTYGCGREPAAEKDGDAAHEHDHGDEHAHSDEGPHGGHIIEIGSEELHVELTHDDAAHKVGVYLVGSDVKTATPIEAESVLINVSVDGAPTQYTLPAVPQPGEADGKSSYFEITDEKLTEIVAGKAESKNVQARVSFKIGDKGYVGLIETDPHDHDHDHDHGHGDEH